MLSNDQITFINQERERPRVKPPFSILGSLDEFVVRHHEVLFVLAVIIALALLQALIDNGSMSTNPYVAI